MVTQACCDNSLLFNLFKICPKMQSHRTYPLTKCGHSHKLGERCVGTGYPVTTRPLTWFVTSMNVILKPPCTMYLTMLQSGYLCGKESGIHTQISVFEMICVFIIGSTGNNLFLSPTLVFQNVPPSTIIPTTCYQGYPLKVLSDSFLPTHFLYWLIVEVRHTFSIFYSEHFLKSYHGYSYIIHLSPSSTVRIFV